MLGIFVKIRLSSGKVREASRQHGSLSANVPDKTSHFVTIYIHTPSVALCSFT